MNEEGMPMEYLQCIVSVLFCCLYAFFDHSAKQVLFLYELNIRKHDEVHIRYEVHI